MSYEKTIYVYGDAIGSVQYIQHYGSDITVVNAARVSYGGESEALTEKDKKLIRFLQENKHTSPFEHCGVTFKFVVPLFVRSQHHRHRTWSYNEISRRYTSRNLQFYTPGTYRTQHAKNHQASNDDQVNPNVLLRTPARNTQSVLLHGPVNEVVFDWTQLAADLYHQLLGAGVAREQARMILPQNLYTEYYGTVSLHNAIKFLDLRLDEHAQWEIRRVAEAMEEILLDLFPESMEAWRCLKN